MSNVPVISDNDVTQADYKVFEKLISDRIACLPNLLFVVEKEGLFGVFLENLSPEHRQHYNCHCCRNFIERFGKIVVIMPDGSVESPLWSKTDVPEFFQKSVEAMRQAVINTKIDSVFVTEEKKWGNAVTGVWTHLHGTPPREVIHKDKLKTSYQLASEHKENFGIINRGLAEYSKEAAVQAVRVLEADAVSNSEKVVEIAKWFLALHEAIEGKKGKIRSNLIWSAITRVPMSWSHIKNTMIGTLLDDITANMPYEVIAKRWAEKMHPLQYKRPTTLNEGNIDAGNRIIEKLGATSALRRRYARLEDIINWVWKPQPIVEDAGRDNYRGGAFDHLRETKKKIINDIVLPAKTVTWDHFQQNILPTANTIEYLTDGYRHGYFSLVTAVDPNAAPILMWDGVDEIRNPVSWYFRHGGHICTSFNLPRNAWIKVNCVCLKPPYWQKPELFRHQGPGVFFVLEGARETDPTSGGLFFPDCLKSEFFEAKKAMEAYSQSSSIEGLADATANGIAVNGNASSPLKQFRVNGRDLYYLQ